MARQFREQLEEEVQLEEARKAQRSAPPYAADSPPPGYDPPPSPADPVPPHAADPSPPTAEPPADPPPPPTFSHAHPTDATGADTSVRAGRALSPDEPGT